MAAKIRIPVDQQKLFAPGAKKTGGHQRGPRTKKQRALMPENQVEKQILDWLHAKGWNSVRQHVVTPCEIRRNNVVVSRFNIGTKGDPDWHLWRPIYPGGKRLNAAKQAVPQLQFLLEAKGKGKYAKPHQEQRIRDMQAIGMPATSANSLEEFIGLYNSMGFALYIK